MGQDAALQYVSKELQNLISFENGKPIINEINNEDIEEANKILDSLDSDNKLNKQAEKKKLFSSLPYSSSLMYNPVSLRTFDTKQNRQIHEKNYIYDKKQVDRFNGKSPISR